MTSVTIETYLYCCFKIISSLTMKDKVSPNSYNVSIIWIKLMFVYLYKPTGAFSASSSVPSFASLTSLGLPTFSKNLCAVSESSPDSVVRNMFASV